MVDTSILPPHPVTQVAENVIRGNVLTNEKVTAWVAFGREVIPHHIYATGWMERKGWWLFFRGTELSAQYRKDDVYAINRGHTLSAA